MRGIHSAKFIMGVAVVGSAETAKGLKLNRITAVDMRSADDELWDDLKARFKQHMMMSCRNLGSKEDQDDETCVDQFKEEFLTQKNKHVLDKELLIAYIESVLATSAHIDFGGAWARVVSMLNDQPQPVEVAPHDAYLENLDTLCQDTNFSKTLKTCVDSNDALKLKLLTHKHYFLNNQVLCDSIVANIPRGKDHLDAITSIQVMDKALDAALDEAESRQVRNLKRLSLLRIKRMQDKAQGRPKAEMPFLLDQLFKEAIEDLKREGVVPTPQDLELIRNKDGLYDRNLRQVLIDMVGTEAWKQLQSFLDWEDGKMSELESATKGVKPAANQSALNRADEPGVTSPTAPQLKSDLGTVKGWGWINKYLGGSHGYGYRFLHSEQGDNHDPFVIPPVKPRWHGRLRGMTSRNVRSIVKQYRERAADEAIKSRLLHSREDRSDASRPQLSSGVLRREYTSELVGGGTDDGLGDRDANNVSGEENQVRVPSALERVRAERRAIAELEQSLSC